MNFLVDRFAFAIDEVDSQVKTTRSSPAPTTSASSRQPSTNTSNLNPHTILQLRQGGRIIRKENGIGATGEWIVAKGRN